GPARAPGGDREPAGVGLPAPAGRRPAGGRRGQRALPPPPAPFPRPDLRHDRHPPGGHGMRVHVIGCSGSFAGPASAASSYLLEHEDADGRLWRVLMDLGSGAFGPLQNVIDPADLDAVIISHLHPDHYLDLTGLEVFWAYHSRTDLGKLPIHAPAPLPDRISGVLGRAGHVPDGVTKAPFDY